MKLTIVLNEVVVNRLEDWINGHGAELTYDECFHIAFQAAQEADYLARHGKPPFSPVGSNC